MNIEQSSTMNVFLRGDSHVKYMPPTYSSPTFNLVIKSVPPLKWIDRYNRTLPVHTLLSSPEVQGSLSQADAILFLVGTNSVRIMPAMVIIRQVETIIIDLQQRQSYLNLPPRISIVSTFPCFKTTHRFPDKNQLQSSINIYNDFLRCWSLRIISQTETKATSMIKTAFRSQETVN